MFEYVGGIPRFERDSIRVLSNTYHSSPFLSFLIILQIVNLNYLSAQHSSCGNDIEPRPNFYSC